MRNVLWLFFPTLALAACGALTQPTPTVLPVTETVSATATIPPTTTYTPRPLPSPTRTAIPSLSATAESVTERATHPPKGYGPSRFPQNINPLTGLEPANPELLNRRPVIVKISNLPRGIRPQWGLSFADQVFEYYTENGTTRFAAIFYGQDAEKAGSIRSGRLVDHHLINMYKGILAFGSADYRVLNLFYNQNYADRLVIETACPPMCRFEPAGANILYTDTAQVTDLINQRKVPGGNGRQNLDGFLFRDALPAKGKPATQLSLRYSPVIYSRWDYDAQRGVYLRSADTQDDFDNVKEVYAPLVDRLTREQISAENVVVLYITHQYFSKKPEIVDIVISGPGKAMLFRDGQLFELTWYRNGLNRTLTLADADGKIFPLKPGKTWFQVIGSKSNMQETADGFWRFVFQMP